MNTDHEFMNLLKGVSENNIKKEYRNIFLKFCQEISSADEYPIYIGLDDDGEPRRYDRDIEGYITINRLRDLDQVLKMFNTFINAREYILEQLESMR